MIDVRDRRELADAMSLILFFAEYVNATLCRRLRRSDDAPEQSGGFEHVPLATMHELIQPKFTWHPRTELLSLLLTGSGGPPIDKGILDALVELILAPAVLRRSARSPNEWTIVGRPSPTLPIVQSSHDPMWLYRLRDGAFGTQLSRTAIGHRYGIRIKKSSTRMADEPINAFLLMEDYLVNVLGVGEALAGHYVQQWLRYEFALPHQIDLKYALARVCRQLNKIFLRREDAARPNPSARTISVGLSLVVDEIARCVSHVRVPVEPHGRSARRRVDTECLGLGIYLAARFAGLFRMRYEWLREQPQEAEEPEIEVEAVSSASLAWREAAAADRPGRQCVMLVRPAEYVHLQTKIWGAISGIPGLNGVFRGGLLPHISRGRAFVVSGGPGSGKTSFALHLMADMAVRGRLAVYVSVEESYETIVDRLVTFGLVDKERYEIVGAGENFEDVIRIALAEEPRRGLLVLYGSNDSLVASREKAEGRPYYVIEALNRIARSLKEFENPWRWRAIAIDSVSGLEFAGQAIDDKAPLTPRAALRSLVEAIEQNFFWGLMLCESDDEHLAGLRYLADTAIELGADDETTTRWIEVRKCRGQKFHSGRHPFRLVEGSGFVIFPSLGAVRSALRRRLASFSPRNRVIPIEGPDIGPADDQRLFVREKSIVLISGRVGSGKRLLGSTLLMEPVLTTVGTSEEFDTSSLDGERVVARSKTPQSVMVICFGTGEMRFRQLFTEMLDRHASLRRKWHEVSLVQVRSFSAGRTLTCEEIIAELLQEFVRAKRAGNPIERLLVEGVEMASRVIPAIGREALFWPSVVDLLRAEAVTTFIVQNAVGPDNMRDQVEQLVDYSFEIGRRHGQQSSSLVVRKWPSLSPLEMGEQLGFGAEDRW